MKIFHLTVTIMCLALLNVNVASGEPFQQWRDALRRICRTFAISAKPNIAFYDGFERVWGDQFDEDQFKDGKTFAIWHHKTSGAWAKIDKNIKLPISTDPNKTSAAWAKIDDNIKLPDSTDINVHSGKYSLMAKTERGTISHSIDLNLRECNSELSFWYYSDNPLAKIEVEITSIFDNEQHKYTAVVPDDRLGTNKWMEVVLNFKSHFPSQLAQQIISHFAITAYPKNDNRGTTFFIDDITLTGKEHPLGSTSGIMKERELEISPLHPLIMLPTKWYTADHFTRPPNSNEGERLLRTWRDIPDDLKPYIMMMGESAKSTCQIAEMNGIPIFLSLRGGGYWPSTRQSMSLLELEELYFKKYSCVKGVTVSEFGWGSFSFEKRKYIIATLKLCATYGKILHFLGGSDKSQIWLDMMHDPELYKALCKYKKYFVPSWETNNPLQSHEDIGGIMGLWLSGAADNWGINPQTWYWAEAGYAAELDKVYGVRGGRTDDMPSPVYGQLIMQGVMAGATVIMIGGERPPDIWNSDGTISHHGVHTILPLLRMILSEQLIPQKAEVLNKIKAAIQADNFPWIIWDDQIFHTGQHSLSIIPGAPNAYIIGDDNGVFRIQNDKEYEMTAWLKSRDVTGKVYPAILWKIKGADGQIGWHSLSGVDGCHSHSLAKGVITGTTDWQEFKIRARPPEMADYAIPIIITEGKYEGTVWCDDVNFHVVGEEKSLPIGNFEVDSQGRNFPDGWNYLAGNACSPDKKIGGGKSISTIYTDTYGRRNSRDFIPRSGRYYFIPIISQLAGKDAQSLFSNIVYPDQFEDPETVRVFFNKLYPDDHNEGFVVNFRDEILYATGSYVNSARIEHVKAGFGGCVFEGDFKSQDYIVAKKTKSGIVVLWDGRPEWSSQIEIFSDIPIKLEGLPDGVQSQCWSPDNKTITLTRHASATVAIKFKIVQQI